jgi:hypothetical protein
VNRALVIAALCACGKKIPSPPDHAELVERDAHLEIVELPSNTFRKFLVREASGAFEVQVGTSDTPKLQPVSLAAGATSVATGPFAGGQFAVIELPPRPFADAVSAIETDLVHASVTAVDGTKVTNVIGGGSVTTVDKTKVTGVAGGTDVTVFAVTGLTKAVDARAKWQPGLAAAFDDRVDQAYVGVFHVPKTDQIVLVTAQIPPRDIAMHEAQSIFDSFVAPARPDPVK